MVYVYVFGLGGKFMVFYIEICIVVWLGLRDVNYCVGSDGMVVVKVIVEKYRSLFGVFR